MSVRLPLREPPSVRELLTRATWAELDRIAARYAVAFSGRRRELAVERLAALLERADQLQAAERLLPDSTRAVLGLLMLLGVVDDERALMGARDRLVAARPELVTVLGRVHLPNEVQTLASLGLCFVDRRRLIVPAEVLRGLTCGLPVARESGELAKLHCSYAELAYLLNALLAVLEEEALVAVQGQRAAVDRSSFYQPLLLTPDVAAQIGSRLHVPAGEVVLLLALLESLGAVASVRGRWQVLQNWPVLSEHPPYELLSRLITAWQQPRALTDLGRTRDFMWRCAPATDCAAQIAQHEASLRALLWRWLGWSTGAIEVESLCQTFAALHPQLLQTGDERGAWITTHERGRTGTSPDPLAVARASVRQLLQQLDRLGLVVLDETSCGLSPVGVVLAGGKRAPHGSPRIVSDGDTQLRVEPLRAPPRTLRLIEAAGRMLPPEGEAARYEIEPVGLSRLQAQGVSVETFMTELMAGGGELTAEFRATLGQWAARAGRVRLHRPITVLLTAEDAPLQQILAAAGVTDGAEIVGPGCALIEPERVESALEQLRARGFWPTSWS